MSGPRKVEASQAPLRSRVAFGVRWGALDQGVQLVLRLGAMVALARLLSPGDIGLMALAFIVINLGSVIVGIGVSEALVQRRNLEPEYVRAALTISTASGILGALLTIALSRPIADLFGAPRLALVLVSVSVIFVLMAVERTPNDMLVREMRFRDFYISSTIATVASVAVAIPLAAENAGVWALVAMALTESVVATGLAWVLALRAGVWRPGWSWDPARARTLLRFGINVTGSRLIEFANVDNIAVGKVLGATRLGYYDLAFRTVVKPVTTISAALGATAFSAFSSVQDDLPRLRGGLARANRYVALVSFPSAVGLIVTAPLLVPAVFGPKWTPAVSALQILAALGPRIGFTNLDGALYQALGQPEWRFRLGVAGLCVTIPGVIIGVQHGIGGVATAVVATSYLTLPLALFLRAHLLESTPLAQLRPIVPALLPTALMAGATVAARDSLEGSLSTSATLTVVVLVGTITFVGALRILSPGLLSQGFKDLFARR